MTRDPTHQYIAGEAARLLRLLLDLDDTRGKDTQRTKIKAQALDLVAELKAPPTLIELLDRLLYDEGVIRRVEQLDEAEASLKKNFIFECAAIFEAGRMADAFNETGSTTCKITNADIIEYLSDKEELDEDAKGYSYIEREVKGFRSTREKRDKLSPRQKAYRDRVRHHFLRTVDEQG